MILLLGCTLSFGQIQSADSNHVLVDKLELKYIVNVFNDYNALKEINRQQVIKNGILERIITDKDKLILLKDEENELLKRSIEDLKPAWYDRFLIGFSSAVAVVISILLIFK